MLVALRAEIVGVNRWLQVTSCELQVMGTGVRRQCVPTNGLNSAPDEVNAKASQITERAEFFAMTGLVRNLLLVYKSRVGGGANPQALNL